jgi:hypothetical protein
MEGGSLSGEGASSEGGAGIGSTGGGFLEGGGSGALIGEGASLKGGAALGGGSFSFLGGRFPMEGGALSAGAGRGGGAPPTNGDRLGGGALSGVGLLLPGGEPMYGAPMPWISGGNALSSGLRSLASPPCLASELKPRLEAGSAQSRGSSDKSGSSRVPYCFQSSGWKRQRNSDITSCRACPRKAVAINQVSSSWYVPALGMKMQAATK